VNPLTKEQRALVEKVMPMARGMARRWSLRGGHSVADTDDLFAVASLALCEAAPNWDPAKGAAWFTYAQVAVKSALRNYVLGRGRGMFGIRAREKGARVCDIEPLSEVLAEASDESLEARIDVDALRAWLRLTGARPRDVHVWQCHVLDGEPLASIGARLGISRARAQQLHARVSAHAMRWPGAREAA